METLEYSIIVLKLIISISILNVWLIRSKKATRWRGGSAQTIVKEFEVYGLSKPIFYLVGFLKISLSLLLLASIKYDDLTIISSTGLTILLFGSIMMHLKIKDPWQKSIPAFIFMLMNLILVFLSL